MTIEQSRTPVDLASQPGLTAKDGQALSLALAADFVGFLEQLTPEEWDAVTPCDPWTVKDIAAHLLGWCDALCSPRALASQARLAMARRDRFDNLLDAQNDAQVEIGRTMSTGEVLEGLRVMLPRAAKLRRKLGAPLRYVPAYAKFLGGPSNLGYLLNSIFPRDLIVHTIDSAQATGRDAPTGDAAARVAADMLRDWTRRTDADATIELTGPGRGEPTPTRPSSSPVPAAASTSRATGGGRGSRPPPARWSTGSRAGSPRRRSRWKETWPPPRGGSRRAAPSRAGAAAPSGSGTARRRLRRSARPVAPVGPAAVRSVPRRASATGSARHRRSGPPPTAAARPPRA